MLLPAGAVPVLCIPGVRQPHVGHPVLHHIGVFIGVGDLVVHRVTAGFGVVGGGSHGAGLRALPIPDLGGDPGLGEVRYRDGVGLAVRHALVVGCHGFGQHVLGLAIAAVLAGVHHHESVVRELGADGLFQIVSFGDHLCVFGGAEAEAAVFPSGNGLGVVAVVQALPFRFFRQVLLVEVAGAVVEDVHVPVELIGHPSLVGVEAAAPQAHGLVPVVAGVNASGVGGLVGEGTLSAVGPGAVGVLHVPGGVGDAVGGVLRHPVVHVGSVHKGGFLTAVLLDGAVVAVGGAVGDDGVYVKGVFPTSGVQPLLRRVVVNVLLRRGGGGEGEGSQR